MAEVLIQIGHRKSQKHPSLLCTKVQIKNQAHKKYRLPTQAQWTQRLVKSGRYTNHLKMLKQTLTGLILVAKRAAIGGFTPLC